MIIEKNVNPEHISEEKLVTLLKEAHALVQVGAMYTHYRGSRYRVEGIAMLDATQEPGILYTKQSGSETLKSIIWVRALSSWMEKTLVNGEWVARFQKE